MEFFRRAPGAPSKLGILPGAFNPPTLAHLALARAALGRVDEVVFVLPRLFPHKNFDGPGFGPRIEMLEAATRGEPRFSVASTRGGLFREIAEECRAAYGPRPELWFVCGSDAAERIVNWDYGEPGAFQRQLESFGLLVAGRMGDYRPPAALRHRIQPLELAAEHQVLSATEVRRRIAQSEPWEDLVPPETVELVRKAY